MQTPTNNETPALLQNGEPVRDPVVLRDGTMVERASVPAGVDYWHVECSPPGDWYPNADDVCRACGALADEVCRPIGEGGDLASLQPASPVRDASDPDPDPLLAAFDNSLREGNDNGR